MPQDVHNRPMTVVLVTPSSNLAGRAQNSLRARLGCRVRLLRWVNWHQAARVLTATRFPGFRIDLLIFDAACWERAWLARDTIHEAVRKFEAPVLLLMRTDECAVCEAAMESGAKGFFVLRSQAEFQLAFPAMVLRTITFYRGEQDREAVLPGEKRKTAVRPVRLRAPMPGKHDASPVDDGPTPPSRRPAAQVLKGLKGWF
ncbi:MAG: hypothetical protein ACFE0O_14625 [Opitutales bacterium]